MTDFQKYDASTHPEIKVEDDYNSMVDHAFEKPIDFLIRQNGSNFEAIYGSGSNKAGKKGVENASIKTVFEWVRDTGMTSGRTWKEKVAIKGNHDLDAQLVFDDYMILQLMGKLTRPDSTDFTLIDTNGKSNIDIIGGIIDGNKDNVTTDQELIDITTGSQHIMIGGMKLQNHIYESIWATGNTTKDIKILNNWFSNQRCCGIWINGNVGVRPSNIIISGNHIYYSYNTEGIALYYCDYATVINNIITYTNRAGIVLQAVKHATVESNILRECGIELDPEFGLSSQPAIFLHNGCEDVGIVDNDISESYTGIYATDAKKLRIGLNGITLCDGMGMYLGGVEGAEIIGNGVSDNSHVVANSYALSIGKSGATPCKKLSVIGNNFGHINETDQRGVYIASGATTEHVVFLGNQFGGLSFKAVVIAGNIVTFRSNPNLNPVGKDTTPFDNTNNQISCLAASLSNTVTSAKEYTIAHTDVFIKSIGGTVSDITIKDASGNTIESGITSLDIPRFLPVGWKIKWTFSVAPTIIVVGN